jgi:SNF2 family DNA or RNA helicase
LRSLASSDEDHCPDCAQIAAKARRKSNVRDANLPPDSAKIRKMLDLLRDIDERSEGAEKTIIFSQFTSMLDLIEPFLTAEGIKYARCMSTYFLPLTFLTRYVGVLQMMEA